MWRRLTIILGMSLVFLILAVPALAAAPSTVPFSGQAQISSSDESLRLNLSLWPEDNSQWQISALLNSVRLRSSDSDDDREENDDRRSDNQAFQLSGRFSITQNQISISGTASGKVYSSGKGQVILVSSDRSVNLQLDFTVTANSNVSGYAQGQFGPITPVVPPAPAITTAPPTTISPAPQPTPVQSPEVQATPTTTQPAAAPAVPSDSSTPPPAEAPQTHSFWYLSRTAAIIAYILLFINIVMGLGMKTNFLDKILSRWQSFDLHQFTALLAMSLIGLHVFALLGDRYMSPSISDLLVPMSGSYRPLWTTLGIISFYFLIAIVLSSLVRKFIGQKAWRVIHMISFALFYVILYHGLRAGTDTAALWAQVMYVATGSAAAFLFLWRFLLAGRNQKAAADIEASIPGSEKALK